LDKPAAFHILQSQKQLKDRKVLRAQRTSWWLDNYFTAAADREAYLITVGGRPAGFALARSDVDGDDGAWNVSEFFVVRAHRRQGVAAQAAHQLFQRHPGPWTLSYLLDNHPASRFWPNLADTVASGPVDRREQQDPPTLLPTSSPVEQLKAAGKSHSVPSSQYSRAPEVTWASSASNDPRMTRASARRHTRSARAAAPRPLHHHT
jgi:predicted acetyltransferase